MSKELWFADMEDKLNELLAEGMEWDKAYEKATEYAEGYMERLVDQADNLRKAERENG